MASTTPRPVGFLEVRVGPMFSEKTTYLIGISRKASRAVKVLYIGPTKDTRSSLAFSTHNDLFADDIAQKMRATLRKVARLSDISNEEASLYSVILIDEAQFYPDLTEEVLRFVEVLGKAVHVVGLSGDSNRKNMGRVHELVCLADSFSNLSTLCSPCAEQGLISEAFFTHCLVEKTRQEQVGARESYIPVCRQCYNDLTRMKPVIIEQPQPPVAIATQPPPPVVTASKKGRSRK